MTTDQKYDYGATDTEAKPGVPLYSFDPKTGIATQVMSDQEIRARALECAVRVYPVDCELGDDSDFMITVKRFEAYIRGENAG